MKKIIFPAILIIGTLSLYAQKDKAALLQDLETSQPAGQDNTVTATVRSSTRLFKAKEDLTSVVMIIPSGSVVSVIDSDSTYLHVTFEENEGFIFRKHAVIDKAPSNTFNEMYSKPSVEEIQTPQTEKDDRYKALENKYGTAMASRIYAGKIWKGMNSEMVRDSWGSAEKINRVINGNLIKEEWIYRSTWLYFENNTLLEWGPANK
jgi:hypothetical protein